MAWTRPMAVGALAAAIGALTPAGAETLQDAVDAALRTNPVLAAEAAEARAADAVVTQARGAGRLNVDLVGTGGYERPTTDQTVDFGAGDISINFAGGSQTFVAAEARATQPVYTGGRVSSGVRQARAGLSAAQAEVDAAAQEVILDTVTAYLDVRRDQEALRIRRSSVDRLREQLRAARDRFDVGVVTRTDVAQAEARFETELAEFAAAEASLEASKAAYVEVVGAEPGALAPPPAPPAPPASFEATVAAAMDANPDLRAARLAETAASEAVGVARSEFRPQISLGASAAIDNSFIPGAGDDIRQTNVTAFAQATVPLYRGGTIRGRVREAVQNREAARFQADIVTRQLRAAAAQAWYGRIAAVRAAEASRRRADAADIAYVGAVDELEIGVRTTLDTLDQEQELLDARLAVIDAERDAFIASAQLLRVIGGLTPAALTGGGDL